LSVCFGVCENFLKFDCLSTPPFEHTWRCDAPRSLRRHAAVAAIDSNAHRRCEVCVCVCVCGVCVCGFVGCVLSQNRVSPLFSTAVQL
jgi:hypothetical protein